MKKKLLIIYNKVWPYRIKIFEEINRYYDLTVGFNDPKFIGRDYEFKVVYLATKKMGPITIHNDNLAKLSKQFDAVIGISNIGWLSLMKLGFLRSREFKLLYWGIGVRASYDNKFDAKNNVDWIRFFLTKKADALIFYSSYPVKKYVASGFLEEKLFVADNTVFAPFTEELRLTRESFLFIGTLYMEKGIELLLEAYKSLNAQNPDFPKLIIVGGGDNFDNVLNWVKVNSLTKKIVLKGAIYDAKELELIFRGSIACISPNQAGLSVLSSMAYGSIFITRKDAYTGGEIFNIVDNETGLFFDGTEEGLQSKMKLVLENKELAEKISINAMNHYREERSHIRMAEKIMSAVKFTLQNQE